MSYEILKETEDKVYIRMTENGKLKGCKWVLKTELNGADSEPK